MGYLGIAFNLTRLYFYCVTFGQKPIHLLLVLVVLLT